MKQNDYIWHVPRSSKAILYERWNLQRVIKFFQDELDCAREAVKMGVKYESIYIEPSSKQLRKERLGI